MEIVKLSQRSADEVADLLLAITPAFTAITSDGEFMAALQSKMPKKFTALEVWIYGSIQVKNILVELLGKHREDLFEILAKIAGASVDDIRRLKFSELLSIVDQIRHDNELWGFFGFRPGATGTK